RKSVLSRYFNKCFATNLFKTCYEELQKSIDLKTDGKEILYELGEVLRKQLKLDSDAFKDINYVNLWPYYAKALKDSMAEFYCTEELQKGLIWNKLIQKVSTTLVTENFNINEILHDSCWKKVRTVVQEKFLNGPSPAQKEAYKILILAKDM